MASRPTDLVLLDTTVGAAVAIPAAVVQGAAWTDYWAIAISLYIGIGRVAVSGVIIDTRRPAPQFTDPSPPADKHMSHPIAAPGAVQWRLVHTWTRLPAMAEAINIHAAKTQFSKLVERAEAGEEILIARAGHPVARLAPLAGPARRTPGGAEGAIVVHDDFDAPLPDEVLRSFGAK